MIILEESDQGRAQKKFRGYEKQVLSVLFHDQTRVAYFCLGRPGLTFLFLLFTTGLPVFSRGRLTGRLTLLHDVLRLLDGVYIGDVEYVQKRDEGAK